MVAWSLANVGDTYLVCCNKRKETGREDYLRHDYGILDIGRVIDILCSFNNRLFGDDIMLVETEADFLWSFRGMAKNHNGAFASDAQRDYMLRGVSDKIKELVAAGFEVEDFWEQMQEMYPNIHVPSGACVFESHITTIDVLKKGDRTTVISTFNVVDYNGVLSTHQIVKIDDSITSVKSPTFERNTNQIQFVAMDKELAASDANRKQLLDNVRIPVNQRADIVGTIIGINAKEEMSTYGYSGYKTVYKMRVKSDDGYVLYGSVPAGIMDKFHKNNFTMIESLKGMKISFTAFLEPSKDDPLFCFYKRPSKGDINDTSIALQLLKERTND